MCSARSCHSRREGMLSMEETGWLHLVRRAEQFPSSPILAAATDWTQARLVASSSSPQKTDSGLLRTGRSWLFTTLARMICSPQQGGQVVAKGCKLLVTLYNLTNGSVPTTLLAHTQVRKEGVEPRKKGMPDRDVLLVQHLLLLLLLLHGVVHLHLPRLPPPRLVLCVVANGGKEKGEGEANQQVWRRKNFNILTNMRRCDEFSICAFRRIWDSKGVVQS